MSGDGKKTKTKQETKLPAWYEDAAKDVIAKGNEVASGGYVPYIGPDVAALSDASKAGMQGIDNMSAAFGMPTSGGASYLPEAQTFAGGVKGYSSFPGFEQSMEALKAKYPGMYDFLSQFNKISQGQSFSPSQSTAFQEKLDPQFNSLMSAITGGNGASAGIGRPGILGGSGGSGTPNGRNKGQGSLGGLNNLINGSGLFDLMAGKLSSMGDSPSASGSKGPAEIMKFINGGQ